MERLPFLRALPILRERRLVHFVPFENVSQSSARKLSLDDTILYSHGNLILSVNSVK